MLHANAGLQRKGRAAVNIVESCRSMKYRDRLMLASDRRRLGVLGFSSSPIHRQLGSGTGHTAVAFCPFERRIASICCVVSGTVKFNYLVPRIFGETLYAPATAESYVERPGLERQMAGSTMATRRWSREPAALGRRPANRGNVIPTPVA